MNDTTTSSPGARAGGRPGVEGAAQSGVVAGLAPAEVVAYRRDGYVHIRGVFDTDRVDVLAVEAGRLEQWGAAQGPDNLRVELRKSLAGGELLNKLEAVADLSAAIAQLAVDGRIVGRVASALGEPPALLKDKLVFKQSGHPGYALHYDHVNWEAIPLPALSVLVALDDAGGDEAVEVFAGCHDDDTDRRSPPAERAVRLLTRAGDIVLFDSLLPHRSGPNVQAGTRRHLYLSYVPGSRGDLRAAYYRHFRAKKLSRPRLRARAAAFAPAVPGLAD